MGCALIEVSLIITNVALWIIIIQAVMSWLIVFNVVNMRNGVLLTIWTMLERMTDPLYRPIRRFMPDLGGLDLSPMVVALLVIFVQRSLINSFPYC